MMTLPFLTGFGFTNGVTAEKTVSAGEKVTKTNGLVSWSVDNTDKSQQNQYTDNYLTYSPVSYTIPIITISGSEVSDTGNTGYDMGVGFSPSAAQDRTSESGVNLTEIIVPVAGIAGVAAIAYVLLGGKK